MTQPNEIQEECTGYDLAIGSVRGVRTWRVDRFGRLTGVTYQKAIWTPFENVATCRVAELPPARPYTSWLTLWSDPLGTQSTTKPTPPEPAPEPCDGNDPSCQCGFYAYHDGVADYHAGDHNSVIGTIEGYGKSTIGSRGFRCSKAKILGLVRPKQMVDRQWALVMRNYPDVAVFERKREMRAAIPISTDLAPSPADPDFWTRGA